MGRDGERGGCLKTTRAKQKQICRSEEKPRKRECLMIFLERRKRAIVRQTNMGTVSKAALGKLLRQGAGFVGFL